MSCVFFKLINMKKILLKLWNLIFTKVIKIIDSYELLVFTLSEHSAAAPRAAATALTLCGDAAALCSCNTALQGLSGCITLSHHVYWSPMTLSHTRRPDSLTQGHWCFFQSLPVSSHPWAHRFHPNDRLHAGCVRFSSRVSTFILAHLFDCLPSKTFHLQVFFLWNNPFETPWQLTSILHFTISVSFNTNWLH